MPIALVGRATYERKYAISEQPEEQWPVFVLKKLSANEVQLILDQLAYVEAGTATSGVQQRLRSGTTMGLRIRYALIDWRNIVDDDGKPVAGTDQNKEKLPGEIAYWLDDDILKVNKLGGLTKDEQKN